MSLAASAGACSAPVPELSPSPSASVTLRLVTIDAPQYGAMDANFSGTLTIDDKGCIQARQGTDKSTVYTLVWPQGYTVQGDAKAFEVVDANRKVVARSGSGFQIGGGLALPNSTRENWTENECAQGHLWIVATPNVSSAK